MNDKGLCQFAIESYQKLVTSDENQGNNVVYSPLSAALALGMTMEGARGKTLANIGQILIGTGLNESNLEAAEQQFKHLIATTNKDNEGVFDMANLIYGQHGFPIKPAFQEKLAKVFGVDGMKQLDLAKEGRQVINADVEKATRGMIKDLIDQIESDVKLILVNALYFKGSWRQAFGKDSTKLQDFTLESGEKRTVWMMNDYERDFKYTRSKELQAKAGLLSYRDSSIEMLLIIPNEKVPLKSIEENLNTAMLIKLLSSMWSVERERVALPRFKIDATHDLKPVISCLGAEDLFEEGQANLSGISDKQLYVSQVIQRAVIEVNEEGTTAAAATYFRCVEESSYRAPPSLVADRPFIYSLIIDQGAKDGKPPIILFIGSVHDPSLLQQNDAP